jgi:hypothetical protein
MLVQPDHTSLSIRRQCQLLGLTRSMLYYLPVGVSAEDQALMKDIDRLFTKWPRPTTSSSSVCGGRSSTRTSTCTPTARSPTPPSASGSGSASTTRGAATRRSTTARRWKCSEAPRSPERWRHERTSECAFARLRLASAGDHDRITDSTRNIIRNDADNHSNRCPRRKSRGPQNGPTDGVHLPSPVSRPHCRTVTPG